MKDTFNPEATIKLIKDWLYKPAGSSKMWNWTRLDFDFLILRMIVYLYEEIKKGEKRS